MARTPKKRAYSNAGVVKLREKAVANGQQSLYLDIYHKGKRSYEFLKLYLTGNRAADAETIRMAEMIRSQREIELRGSEFGLTPTHLRKASFVEYFGKLADSKPHKSWRAAHQHLEKFTKGQLSFEQITTAKLEAFKLYLLEHLHNNSAWLYYGKVRSALNQAVREGYLQSNPASKIEGISRQAIEIAFLTLEEIKQLKAAPCPNDAVRRAFLFSCFTGLARCDIRTLTWGQVKDGWIRYRRQKTKETVNVPIHPEALAVIGTSGRDAELVFRELPCDRYVGIVLTKWMQSAGITKNVTFHGARHTFATLSLTYGADIYTVSKLLGHTSVKVTQEYAKVIDRIKEEAVMRLPRIG